MRTGRALAAACLLLLAGAARGESDSDTGTGSLTATARLDFILNVGRFIFFRVGPGNYPNASSTVGQVDITVRPSIPSVPTVPTVSGNNVVVPWSGATPGSSAVLSDTVPVTVRTNAGQVSIRANAVSPLVNGANGIPLSQILVSSSDTGLPAPTLPDTGTGPSVTVSGTAFGNLVTVRNADWTFSYSPAVLPPAGTYTGQVSFTAVSP